jgi:uncharacterized protein
MTPHPGKNFADVTRLIAGGQYREAYAECLPPAEAGDAAAQTYIGWMHHKGAGVARDPDEAERWYQLAARSAPPRAEYCLATLCWDRQQTAQMVNRLLNLKSASSGFAPALYDLGRASRFGYGVPVDEEKAWTYYEQAVFARRDLARQMLKGRRGLRRVLPGFLIFVMNGVRSIRLGSKDRTGSSDEFFVHL